MHVIVFLLTKQFQTNIAHKKTFTAPQLKKICHVQFKNIKSKRGKSWRKKLMLCLSSLWIGHPSTLLGQSQTLFAGLKESPGGHGIVYRLPFEHCNTSARGQRYRIYTCAHFLHSILYNLIGTWSGRMCLMCEDQPIPSEVKKGK